MKISEKAEDTPDIDLVRQSAPAVYRLESLELRNADDLTGPESFPEFGDFLSVVSTSGGDQPSWTDERWIECPSALAQFLVENNISDGDCFRIRSVTKVDGEWQYSAEPVEDPTD